MDGVDPFIPLLYREEGKKIIELLDNLTPWDRLALIEHYAWDKLSHDEFYSAFIENTEYEYDPVESIVQNNQEDSVLEAIDDNDEYVIPNWVVEHGKTGRVIKNEEFYEIASALSRLPKKKLYDTIERLAEYAKNKVKITVELIPDKKKC